MSVSPRRGNHFFTMPLNLTQLASDLAFMVADLPTSVTWNGQSFNAVVGDIGTGDTAEIEGFTATATLTVDYVLSAVSGTIQENDLVTISGNQYRVAKVSILPDGLTGRFDCVGGQE